MPNSLNYGTPLENTLHQRPDRLQPADLKLIQFNKQQVLFGTTARDVVELWIYNPDGSFAGHVNLGPTDSALHQATLIDQSGPYEILNIDFRDVGNRLDIQPGRYAFVANIFRDEVGSEKGARLYIATISDDRTELRLEPVAIDDAILSDIFEFVVPSVPKLIAKGLIDEVFGLSLNPDNQARLSVGMIEGGLDVMLPGTMDRVERANIRGVLENLVITVLGNTYKGALDLMAADVTNLNVQQIEIENYLGKALDAVIYSMQQSGEIDPRFTFTS
jgi:hypothetical protein